MISSVCENFEGIAGLRTGKTFKMEGPASLLQVFTVVTYDAFTKYCQSSRTCKYFKLPVHLFYGQPGAEDLHFSRRLDIIPWWFSKILENTLGARLNQKDGLTRYGNSHVKDKTS